jgi:hypothetical protein
MGILKVWVKDFIVIADVCVGWAKSACPPSEKLNKKKDRFRGPLAYKLGGSVVGVLARVSIPDSSQTL